MKVRILIVLSLLATLSIGTLYLFLRNPGQGTLSFEIAKSLLQVGVVAVAGAVISLLTFEYQQERQEAEKARDLERKLIEYREGLLMSTLTAAMKAYARTKKARRLMRARARVVAGGRSIVLATEYDFYLDWINDAQLDFENLARDIDNSRPAFTNPNPLKEKLQKMDSYLGTLITEYEDKRNRFRGEPQSLPLEQLPILDDCLAPTKKSEFLTEVVVPYHDVLKGLRQDLLHPNLVAQTTKRTKD